MSFAKTLGSFIGRAAAVAVDTTVTVAKATGHGIAVAAVATKDAAVFATSATAEGTKNLCSGISDGWSGEPSQPAVEEVTETK